VCEGGVDLKLKNAVGLEFYSRRGLESIKWLAPILPNQFITPTSRTYISAVQLNSANNVILLRHNQNGNK
jgi:hypothetical protein